MFTIILLLVSAIFQVSAGISIAAADRLHEKGQTEGVIAAIVGTAFMALSIVMAYFAGAH